MGHKPPAAALNSKPQNFLRPRTQSLTRPCAPRNRESNCFVTGRRQSKANQVFKDYDCNNELGNKCTDNAYVFMFAFVVLIIIFSSSSFGILSVTNVSVTMRWL